MKNKSVCLIVDNPLRDLNGLVLLAYQLVKRGMDVWLVPMYEQWSEIQAIRPDAVMVNYLRANNRDHVISYLRAGMMVGVLETEGVAGRSLAEFCQLVSTTGCADLLDLYCLWGASQRTALLEGGVVPEAIAKLTGCPRYDFCAQPWRQLLQRKKPQSYVLINTNFPSVNPRFSAGGGAEITAMVSAGFPAESAAQYIQAARLALSGMIELLEQLLVKFAHHHFVLRPHPFESPAGYQSLRRFPNLEIRQEGTSLEWLAYADALIHLNCSTGVEARMLGVPALSPSWLNAPPLHVPLASDLSLHHDSAQEFCDGLSLALSGENSLVMKPSSEAIENYYFLIDGEASSRVADVIVATIKSKKALAAKVLPAVPLGFKIKAIAKSMIGARNVNALARRQAKIAAKSFSAEQVSAHLAGICLLDPEGMPSMTEVCTTLPSGRSSVLVRANRVAEPDSV